MPVTLPTTKYENNNRVVSGTVAVEDSDVFLYCDTSAGAVTINLKEIPGNQSSTLYKLYIKDNSANASVNNITIVAPTGFKINTQQSIVINVNSGLALVRIGSSTDYVAELNYGIVGENAIAVKNTAYVMKNGSDTTGLVERFDKPFLTINAAMTALRTAYPDASRSATFRVKVIVEDGTYDEGTMQLYPYIDIDLGNSVLYAWIRNNASGVTYSSNPNNDFTTKIFGNARIYRTSGGVSTIYLNNVSARTLIQCDTISSDRDDSITMELGYARVICNQIYNNNISGLFPAFSHAIEMSQAGNSSSATNVCRLDVVNAFIYMLNPLACTIHFADSGGSTSFNVNQSLNLYNCTVVNTLGSGADNALFSAIGVGITHPAQPGNTLNLYNSVLYSKYGQTIFISNAQAKANLIVYYYNLTNGNTDSLLVTPDANHVLTEYLKTTGFAIDANVLPVTP